MKIKEQTRKLPQSAQSTALRLWIELMKSAQNTVLRLQIELTKSVTSIRQGEADVVEADVV
ncbi:lysyl-tRNA synthetase [Streptococcus sp. VT 162]|nr:lysyl-tRNA synthetase [Streptococcus sp. VT 162]